MNVAVLRSSRSASQGAVYRFRGAHGGVAWPTTAGERLGAAGCWNFALRIGGCPREVEAADIATLSTDEPLFVALDRDVNTATVAAVRHRLAQGGWVIGSGQSAGWTAVVPDLFSEGAVAGDNPYAALAYRVDAAVELIAPPGWPVHSFAAHPDLVPIGQAIFVSGERQSPARALLTDVAGAPAIIRRGRFVFLNGAPFHALQAWLQGQEDLEPWIAWRHRLFWLDEWVGALRALLGRTGVPLPSADAPIPGLDANTVVLRHDLDYSRDTSYLDAEKQAGLPAVHAVLRDGNARFWRDRVAAEPGHEVAFHYNTARYSRVENAVRRLLGWSARPYLPDRSAIAGRSLTRQVRWAARQTIGVLTLHRHLPFIIYPEYIDALDAVLQDGLGVLGGSSFFRGHVLRWGVDRADGARGTYADHPDAMFPYWMPFKLAHAGDGGRLVGWESTSLMELEAGVVEQMLGHHVAGVRGRIITLNFHPAHARRATFRAGGSLANFTQILELLRAHRAHVVTLEHVFTALNRFVAVPAEISPR